MPLAKRLLGQVAFSDQEAYDCVRVLVCPEADDGSPRMEDTADEQFLTRHGFSFAVNDDEPELHLGVPTCGADATCGSELFRP